MVAATGGLIVKMVIAAFAGMGAATVCHPLDVIRVQMQTEGAEYNNIGDCATQIAKREGVVKGLYAGISAAYLRQWLYGSCRIGIYAYLLEQAQHKNIANGVDKNQIIFRTKLLMGMASGGIGSFVGTPSELVFVRMSNDSKLSESSVETTTMLETASPELQGKMTLPYCALERKLPSCMPWRNATYNLSIQNPVFIKKWSGSHSTLPRLSNGLGSFFPVLHTIPHIHLSSGKMLGWSSSFVV
jgi:hypothetical protein